MSIKNVTLEAVSSALPADLSLVFTPPPGGNDADFLAELAFKLWKQGVECQCVCEGKNEGEVIIIVDYLPDGECS
ncbi:MAG: hypothetical protein JNM99_14815 [Verrucomicrobiaceae bacterium]|nr:hypothetical protein [Verrucomicrobiaceae bacterium]